MSPNPEITSRLANRLKEERTAKGLSLEALAKLSGVSRSMISQIERGEASPTVASLWNLTTALNVDFAELLDANRTSNGPIIEVLRSESTPVIHQKEYGCHIRILNTHDDVGQTEIYEIAFEQGGLLDSSAHRQGSVEHLTVLDGRLKVTTDGHAETVNSGDTIRYKADCPHAIEAEESSRILLVVKS